MYNRNILKLFIIVVLIIICTIVYFRLQVAYKISKQSVKAIYCTYWDKDGTHKIEVNDSDKEIIIPEVSKMKRSGIEGQVATLGYKFTIELVDGTNLTFYENSTRTVSLQQDKDHFFRNIMAPQTATFINKFIAEHSINAH